MTKNPVEQFVDAVRPIGHQIIEMYLFGSRARSDWRPDSDYDLLIVVKRKNDEIVSRLYEPVMDILLSTGRLISLKVFTLEEFERLKSIPTPFLARVLEEGRRIGHA